MAMGGRSGGGGRVCRLGGWWSPDWRSIRTTSGEADVDDERASEHLAVDAAVVDRKRKEKAEGGEASGCPGSRVGCRSRNDLDRNGQRAGVREGG